MADEDAAQDVVAEITPEQFDGENVAATDAESSTAKDKEATEVKADDQSKEEAQGDDTPAEPEADEQTEETEPDSDDEKSDAEEPENDKPQTKAEERKSQLNAEIRELVAQRNAIKKEVEKQTGEVYAPATENDLVEEINPETGEKYTNIEAKLEAMRQEQEMSKYNERVAESQLAIGAESIRVLNDFPIFNPDSDQYDEELASEAAYLLEANLIRDNNVPELDENGEPTGRGIVIGSNVSPYRIYKAFAHAREISQTKGQIKGQQAKEEMLANADAPASTAPPKQKEDPIVALWKEDD